MVSFIVTLRKKEEGFNAGDQAIQVQSQVQSKVQSVIARMLHALTSGELSKSELAQSVGRKKRDGQIHAVVNSLLSDKLIERTIQNKPNSRMQKYRLTTKGVAVLAKKKSGIQ